MLMALERRTTSARCRVRGTANSRPFMNTGLPQAGANPLPHDNTSRTYCAARCSEPSGFKPGRLPRSSRPSACRTVSVGAPRASPSPSGVRTYAALLANSMGSIIEGSSFSGLLTRVEIGHIRIRPAGNGRIRSRGSTSSLSQRV
jgi:hypothetical protein